MGEAVKTSRSGARGPVSGNDRRVRLYVDAPFEAGASVAIDRGQSHYLSRVMRLGAGDTLAVFNGRDGEWRATIAEAGRGRCTLRLDAQARPQRSSPDLCLLFAPIKSGRIDFLAAKAAELGVSALWPVLTRRTQVARVNLERLRANVIEACEQCGRLDVPTLREPEPLERVLESWPEDRHLLFCDETGGPPIAEALHAKPPGPWAVLIGPEGGFAPEETELLRGRVFVVPASLGPRLLRTETAAVAALALWQASLGDWRESPGRTT